MSCTNVSAGIPTAITLCPFWIPEALLTLPCDSPLLIVIATLVAPDCSLVTPVKIPEVAVASGDSSEPV